MQQIEVLILIESPLSERDYWRFGIEQLKKLYKVVILDCTPWLKPKFWKAYKHLTFKCDEYFHIQSGRKIIDHIQNPQRIIVIDHLGNQREVNLIRRKLKALGVIRAIVLLGPIPFFSHQDVLFYRFKRIFSRGILNALKMLHFYMLHNFRSSEAPVPDIAICSGRNSASKSFLQSIPNTVWAHSFDYETYRGLRKGSQVSEGEYAVFLDEDMAFHSDYMHHGLPSPVSPATYYSLMNNFFLEFEKNFGLKVVIAAHPRSNPDLALLHWKRFKIYRSNTPELVNNAKLVFCHQSTSISFAILSYRPIIFLTTDELANSWLGNRISGNSKLLKSELLNINNLDGSSEWNRIRNVSIDRDAYLSYKHDYIKTKNSEDIDLWQIFIRFINKHFELN